MSGKFDSLPKEPEIIREKIPEISLRVSKEIITYKNRSVRGKILIFKEDILFESLFNSNNEMV